MFGRFLSLISFRAGIAVLVIFSAICTQIPLFNYLGFEFSVVTSLLASFISGLVSISLCRKLPTQNENGAKVLITHSSEASLLLLMIPFSLMSLNVLLVKNCDYGDGVAFFLLINVPATLFANSIALLIYLMFKRWARIIFTLVYISILAHIPVVTFTSPQIFAFNPILGFFPGLTYDEALNVFSRLSLYRGQTVASIILFWMIIEVVFQRRIKRREWKDSISRKQSWTGLPLAITVALFMWFSNSLGLSSSEEYIQQELGGMIETDHFVVSYPSTMKPARLQELLALHEFYYDRISRELRVAPVRKIHSFLYVSAEQKGRFIGAGRTNISKPWLWQLHINLDDVEGSLKHELVHVMAAEFGFPFLRIGLNSGLIEGLAVAVERTSYDATVHLAAAEIVVVGVHPDMARIFSITGFMRISPGVGYTLAGSFCRFLIDHYGLRRFKRVYRTGDFKSVYNKDFEMLLSEWRRQLEKFQIRDTEKQRAEFLFKRPSIFGKECARAIAAMNANTRLFFVRREYSSALASATLSLERSTNVEAVFQKMNSLFRLRQYTEAIDFAQTGLKDSSIAHSLLPIFVALGDSYWASGNRERALEAYQLLLSTHVSLSIDEACAVRLEALFDRKNPESLQEYFVEDLADSDRTHFLRDLVNRAESRIGKYLLARDMSSKEKYHEAIQTLSGTWRMELPVLEFLRQKRIGQLYFKLGEYQKAKLHFWDSLNFTSNEAFLLETDEWLKRCDWMQERASRPNL